MPKNTCGEVGLNLRVVGNETVGQTLWSSETATIPVYGSVKEAIEGAGLDS